MAEEEEDGGEGGGGGGGGDEDEDAVATSEEDEDEAGEEGEEGEDEEVVHKTKSKTKAMKKPRVCRGAFDGEEVVKEMKQMQTLVSTAQARAQKQASDMEAREKKEKAEHLKKEMFRARKELLQQAATPVGPVFGDTVDSATAHRGRAALIHETPSFIHTIKIGQEVFSPECFDGEIDHHGLSEFVEFAVVLNIKTLKSIVEMATKTIDFRVVFAESETIITKTQRDAAINFLGKDEPKEIGNGSTWPRFTNTASGFNDCVKKRPDGRYSVANVYRATATIVLDAGTESSFGGDVDKSTGVPTLDLEPEPEQPTSVPFVQYVLGDGVRILSGGHGLRFCLAAPSLKAAMKRCKKGFEECTKIVIAELKESSSASEKLVVFPCVSTSDTDFSIVADTIKGLCDGGGLRDTLCIRMAQHVIERDSQPRIQFEPDGIIFVQGEYLSDGQVSLEVYKDTAKLVYADQDAFSRVLIPLKTWTCDVHEMNALSGDIATLKELSVDIHKVLDVSKGRLRFLQLPFQSTKSVVHAPTTTAASSFGTGGSLGQFSRTGTIVVKGLMARAPPSMASYDKVAVAWCVRDTDKNALREIRKGNSKESLPIAAVCFVAAISDRSVVAIQIATLGDSTSSDQMDKVHRLLHSLETKAKNAFGGSSHD